MGRQNGFKTSPAGDGVIPRKKAETGSYEQRRAPHAERDGALLQRSRSQGIRHIKKTSLHSDHRRLVM
jgi:hypothetical protein